MHIATAEGYAQLPYSSITGEDDDAWLSGGWEPPEGDEG